MSGESVKVVVRCRPLNQREKDLKSDVVVLVDNSKNQVGLKNPEDSQQQPPKQFTFDGVYGIDSNTESIYNDLGFALVESVCEGYNGTVFAYGQTGCGKSFTMQGIPSQKGIIPRAFEHIFEAVATDTNKKYLIRASYLEIYNENVRDLLGKDYKQTLDIHEHPEKGVYIQSLTWHECKRSGDCERLMDKGNKNRATGATLMNADSSRSHSIFTINVEMCERDQSDGEEHYRLGKLNLVDLAGSERQSKTGASGDRLKEATKINLSLSALGNVISALVDGKSKHVPYRDSKLTRLLQDSLGGNTKTLMIAAISPAADNYDETLSTLRYANRAKNIKNKPKINEDPKDAMLRELQDEIKRLKDQLAGKAPMSLQSNSRAGDNDQQREIIEEEKKKLKLEFEDKINEIKQQYEEEKMSKEALMEQMEYLRRQYDAQVDDLESTKTTNPGVNYQTGTTGGRPTKSARGNRNVTGKPPRPPNKQQGDVNDDAAAMSDSSVAGDPQQRLLKLEQMVVGGELSNNEELKKKRNKKKKEAEERKRMLAEALRNGDDDEFMLRVYDSVQEEVQYKTRELEKEKKRVQFLENEVKDLQREFEREREEYLDTIRKQEKQLKLVIKLSQKIQTFVPHDSNYYNLDRVQTVCVWNEELQDWQVPDVKREKLSLPSMNNNNSNNHQQNSHNEYSYNGDFEDDDDNSHVVNHHQHHHHETSPNAILQARRKSARPVHSATARRLLLANNSTNNNNGSDYDDVVYANDPRRASGINDHYEPPDQSDRLRMKLENTQYNGNNYFKNKRQSELLSQTQDMKNSNSNSNTRHNNKYY